MFALCFFLGNNQEINTIIKTSTLGENIEEVAKALSKASADNCPICFWDDNDVFHQIDMGEVSYFRLEGIKED